MSASPPADPALLPLFLRLDGHRVVVVGGGGAALAKVRLLRPTGAAITLIEPDPDLELREWVDAHGVTWLDREPAASDFAGTRLCFVAIEGKADAASIAAMAEAAGAWVNVVDQPALSDCIVPAIINRAPIAVAVGTGGAAPALARDLRARVEQAVPAAYGTLAALCGRWRDRVTEVFPDAADRRRFWDAVLDGPEAQAVLDGDLPAAEQALESRLAGGPVPRGRVSLVGAGPGDPELLTARALRVLKRADVVLYDALIDPAILDLARRDARRIDVGKRCGRHPMNQAAINTLILRHAQDGRHVVRLKGGDPLVFGRGGEELVCLREAGVPVDIVPGVTAACAAAAALGVPLTHRGLARSLHFITGHSRDGGLPPHDWAALARAGGTIAAYMATRTLTAMAEQLMAAGMAGSTPAVAVSDVSRPTQAQVRGTLASLPALLSDRTIPTLVLIGAVTAMADTAEQIARDAA